MNDDKEKLLKQVNIDIIFFSLATVAALVSLYLIKEKKKSIISNIQMFISVGNATKRSAGVV